MAPKRTQASSTTCAIVNKIPHRFHPPVIEKRADGVSNTNRNDWVCVERASYEVEAATVCFSVLGLHYTFATNFLVSLFDEKLSRREIDPTNFLQLIATPLPRVPACLLTGIYRNGAGDDRVQTC